MKKLLFFLIFAFALNAFLNRTVNAQSWQNVGSIVGFSDNNTPTHITLDTNGVPYVVYNDIANGNKATVKKFDGTNWVPVGVEGFSAGVIVSEKIAIDHNGTPFVAYSDLANSGKLTVMKFDGTNWVSVGSTGFSTGPTGDIDLKISNSGIPYVAFVTSSGITVKKFDGTDWINVGSANFNTTAGETCFAFDNNEIPYVSFFDGSDVQIKIMKFDGSNWIYVASGFGGGMELFPTIAFNSSNILYVAYLNKYQGCATMKKLENNNWVTVGQPNISNSIYVEEVTMAIDNHDIPYVCYHDFYQDPWTVLDKAFVKKFDGSNWVSVGTGSISIAIWYPRMVINSSGTPYMCFVDDGDGNTLKVNKFSCVPPSIASQSTDGQTQCIGGIFNPITVVSSDTNLTYQWYSNSVASNIGGISLGTDNGAQSSSYTPQSSMAGTLYYYCVVTGDCDSVLNSAVSGAFIVTTLPNAPTNTTPPANQTISSGTSTNLSASGIGTLGWYDAASGGNLVGTGANFTTPVLAANTTYYVQDSADCGASLTRTAITVTVNCIVNIPDANFKAALLAIPGLDANSDGEIQCSEAATFTGQLIVSGKGISDLMGIEAFTQIWYLDCRSNALTSLDVSGNTALTMLYCGYNSLTSLNVSANTALQFLDCSPNSLTNLNVLSNIALTDLICGGNPLTSLNISSNIALTRLICDHNLLTSLDVSSNTSLIHLYCNFNSLTSLDVSSNIALSSLYCGDNSLTSLDVSSNTALNQLDCHNNHLTSLNVSSNHALTDLECQFNSLTSLDVSNTNLTFLLCSDNLLATLDVSSIPTLTYFNCCQNSLTSLDVKNGNNTALTYFYASNNPDLTCIKVDDVSWSNANWTNKDYTASYSIDCICENPSITSQLTDGQSQCINGTFNPISVSATGTNLMYQWFKNNSNNYDGGISLGIDNGAQTNTYTPQASVVGSLYYYCIVSGDCGSPQTSAVSGVFEVVGAIVTTDEITNISETGMTYGGNVVSDCGLEVTARGICGSTSHNPTLADHVTVDGSGTGAFTNSLTGITGGLTYYARAYATNSAGTTYGNEVTFTIPCTTTAITGQSIDGQVQCLNGTFTPISVSAVGTNLIYQWYKNTMASNSGGTLIGGAQNNSYTPQASLIGNAYYYCVVSGDCGIAQTSAVSGAFEVKPNTIITGQSTNGQSMCLNGTYSEIHVYADGFVPTFQWYSNTIASNTGGTSLGFANGAQTNTYTPQANVVGTLYYYCEVGSGCGLMKTSAVSGAFITNSGTPPDMPTNVTATPSSLCQGSQTHLNATSPGSVIFWYTSPTGGMPIGSSASGVDFPISVGSTTTYYAGASTNFVGNQTFNYTGSQQTFIVPAGVTSMDVTLYGGQGGLGIFSGTQAGGLGGMATGTLAVTPGQTLYINVGQGGVSSSGSVDSAYNGGGAAYGTSGNNRGAGGGASDIRINGSSLTNRVIVAGGGGGACGPSYAGAVGGGLNGGNAIGGIPGLGGTQISGGNSYSGYGLTNGSLGQGGGVVGTSYTIAGGGGGYYGGGAGNGAGGGSSYIGGVINGTTTSGVHSGNGQIIISWSVVGCTSVSRTPVVLNINSVPVASASNNSPKCASDTINLISGGGVSYSWSGPNGFNSSEQNPSINNVTLANAGTYTVTVTNEFSCTSIASTNVIINAAPTVIASNNSPVCNGSNLLLASSEGVSHSWIGPNGFNSSEQNPSIIGVSSDAAGTYTVSVMNSEGCIGLNTTLVTFNPIPDLASNVTATPSSVCAGSTTNLNATALNQTIFWYTSPIGGIPIGSSQSGVDFTITPDSTTTYYAEASSTNIGSQTFEYTGSQQTFTVPAGVMSISIDAYGAQGGGNKNGSTGGLGGRIQASSVLVTPGSTIYVNVGGAGVIGNSNGGFNGGGHSSYYNYTGSGGGASDVRVGGAGLYNRVIVAGGGGGAGLNCSGSNEWGGAGGGSIGGTGWQCGSQNYYVGYGGTQYGGGAYGTNYGQGCATNGSLGQGGNGACTYGGGGGGGYYGGGGGGYGGGGGGSSYTSGSLIDDLQGVRSGNGQIIISWSAQGCASLSRTPVVIDIKPVPVVSALSNSPLCGTSTLNLTGEGGVSYSWSGPNSFSSTEQNPIITNVTTANAGRYFVTVTGENGCTAIAYTDVIVNSLPLLTSTSNSPICEGSTLNLTSSEGVSYSWTGPNGFSSTDRNPTLNNVTLGASGIYSVSVMFANGCLVSVFDTVLVQPLFDPISNITATSPISCGQSSSLNATSLGGSINWYTDAIGGIPIGNSNSGADFSVSPTVTTIYYAESHNTCSSAIRTSVTVIVNSIEAPTNANASSPSICSGDSTNLSAISTANLIYWYSSPVGGSIVGISNSGSNFNVKPDSTTTYYAEANNVLVNGGLDSLTFNYTGGEQTFTVPMGVNTVTIEAFGAQGSGGNGGYGGFAKGTMSVIPGQVLNVYVGGQTGYNGGGNGWASTIRNGGGASDVRLGGTALTNRIIVAGGGGSSSGDGNYQGGVGGGGVPIGLNFVGGGGGIGYGGYGGAGSIDGGTGNTSCHAGGAGGGGMNSGGSPSCNTCYTGSCGTAGTLGQGGNGDTWENGYCHNSVGGTSGGGGGYFGGGGTSTGNCGGGGGGGGSSWTGTLTNPSFIAGSQSGNGQVVISWNSMPVTCPSSSRTPVTVTVNPAFTVIASSNSPLCVGNTLNLTSSDGVSYLWTGPDNFTSTEQNPSIPNVKWSASGTYTVTVTNEFGCSKTATTNVIIDNFNGTIIPQGSTTFCMGGSVLLSSTTGNGYSYQWKLNGNEIPGATNSTYSADSSGDYTVFVTNSNGCTATFGSDLVSSAGGYSIHKFLSNGTFVVSSDINAKVLVVAGGGGGGTNMGGGGGGGGVIYDTSYAISPGSYAITVGTGVAGAPAGTGGHPNIPGSNGGNSIFSTLTAIGGGYGGTSPNSMGIQVGNSGGSGGGTSGYNDNWVSPGYYGSGEGTLGQGYRGGYQGNQYYSGGGGGAGGAGADGNNQANGGPGLYCDILGTSYYWGGGGGGAGYSIGGGNGGIGGGGGGAIGITTGGAGYNNGLPGTDGCTSCQANVPGGNAGANTGGGGGGGSHYNYNNKGGDGGSGIVVIAVPNSIDSGISSPVSVVVRPFQTPNPMITANGPTTFCSGNSVTLDAGSYSSYIWSSGSISESINVSNGGVYSVTITDENGCIGSTSQNVTVNPNPTYPYISLNGSATFCEGGSLVMDAVGGFSSFVWSNGVTSETDTVTSTGYYVVTVTNEFGCVNSASIYIQVNPNPIVNISANGPVVFCPGGSVALDAGSYASYLWNTNEVTKTITTSNTGIYSVTVTDGNGCTGSASQEVTVNGVKPIVTCPSDQILISSSDQCGANASFTASTDFGTLSYSLYSGEITSPYFFPVGNNIVTTIATNGTCYDTCIFNITVNDTTAPVISDCPSNIVQTCQGAVYYTVPTVTDNCNSSVSGSHTFNYTGSPETFIVPDGVFSITVKAWGAGGGGGGHDGRFGGNGGGGAFVKSNIPVNPGEVLTLYVGGGGTFGVGCNSNSGHGTGGFGFGTGGNGGDPGPCGCSGAGGGGGGGSAVVHGITPLLVAAGGGGGGGAGNDVDAGNGGGGNVNGYGTNNSSGGNFGANGINVGTNGENRSSSLCDGGSGGGGGGGFHGGLGGSSPFNGDASGGGGGGGSSLGDSIANGIEKIAGNSFLLSALCPTCSTGGSGQNNGSYGQTSGGDGLLVISYDAVFPKLIQTAGLNSGDVFPTGTTTNTFLAIDGSGNTTTCSFTVTVQDSILPKIITNGNTTFCEGGNVVLDAGSYLSYVWNTGDSTETITAVTGGVYSVTVTNGNGCAGVASITLIRNPKPAPTITGGSMFCTSGIIDAGIYNSYLWNDESTQETLTVTSTGNYSVTVTDGNGCIGTSSLGVVVNSLPSNAQMISGANIVCQGQSETFSVPQINNADYYVWSLPSGATGSSSLDSIIVSFNNSAISGNISVFGHNSCGDGLSSSLYTAVNPLPSGIITSQGSTTFCQGGSVLLSTTYNSDYSYQWTNNGNNILGATNSTYIAEFAGIFSVIVTNSNGCSSTIGSDLPTGGTLTNIGGYRIHTFTSDDTLNVPFGFNTNARVLVVAGGGGGCTAGGGGAGGFIETMVPLSSGIIPITVGAGGNGSDGNSPTNGGNSVFQSLIAIGGGGGGGANGTATAGHAGGSGGGGGMNSSISIENGYGGSGTPGQGHDGGTIAGQSCSPCGGGGGAGGPGGAGAYGQMFGGPGLPSSISGTTVYYAGGGGGGSYCAGAGQGGIGGGGAGNGGYGSPGNSGTPNTGGGGGGANWGPGGGAGGSGIVIVAYPDSITSSITVTINTDSPVPGFIVSDTIPVVGELVAFTDTTHGLGNSRFWNFGDGSTSTDLNPIHAYTQGGIFNVKLIESNCAGSDSIFEIVHVTYQMCTNSSTTDSYGTLYDSGGPNNNYNSNENCSFLINPGCLAILLDITSLNTENGYDYLNLYDGDNSSAPLLLHATGNILPGVVTATSGKCFVTFHSDGSVVGSGFTLNWTTAPLTIPSSAFTISNPNPIAGQSVAFINNTSGTNTQLWHFGDGSTSTDLNPTHTYNTGGIFDITLVEMNCAGSDSITQTITVVPQGTYYRICADASSSDASGTLFDIGGPNLNYENNENCNFLINPGCLAVTLSLTSLNTENGYDYLNLYDGDNSNAPLLLHATGSTLPGAVTATSGKCYVTFHSDGSAVGSGFTLNWTTAPLVVSQPGFIISNTSPIVGQPIAFADTTHGNGNTRLWDFGDGNISIDLNPTHFYSDGGTYNIKLIEYNCSGSDSVTKTINVQNNSVQVQDVTICEGNSGVLAAHLTYECASSYLWNTGETTGSIDVTSGGIYCVTVTDCFGNSDVTCASVNMNLLPEAAGLITGSAFVCSGQNEVAYIIDTIPNATSYIWTLPNGTTGVSNNRYIVINYTDNAVSGDITVKGLNSCGEGITSTLHITVKPLPVISYTSIPSLNVCIGDSITLNGTGASYYSWSNEINDGVTFVPINSSTYYVTGTDSTGCSAIAQVHVTVGGTFDLSTSFVDATCGQTNGSASVMALGGNIGSSSPETYNYLWDSNAGNQTTATANSIGAGSYSVTVTDANGCSKTTSVSISDIQDTLGGHIQGSTTVCAGTNSTLLTLSGYSGNIIKWQSSQDNWNTFNDITNTSNTFTVENLINTTQYRAIVQNGMCNPVYSTIATITVHLLVEAAGEITGPIRVCQGQSNVLYSVPPIINATSYIWTLPNGTMVSTVKDSLFVNFTSNLISGNIAVKGHNDCGDGVGSVLAIDVNPLPGQPGSISGNANICLSQNQYMQTYSVAPVTDALTYIWSLPSGIMGSSDSSSINVYLISEANGYITLKGENSCGFGPSSQFHVVINSPSIAPTEISGEISKCIGSSATLYVNGGFLGSGATWHWYSDNLGNNPLGTGSSISLIPVLNDMLYVRAEGICNNTDFAVRTVTEPINHPPTLSYTGNPGFTNHFVDPTDGLPSGHFIFKVRYTNVDGLMPSATYPRVMLDFEGNGVYTNPNDRMFYMNPVDPNDLDVTDGKDYYYDAFTLPESANWTTTFVASDDSTCSTSTNTLVEPMVMTKADITIFANDITFSNYHPNPSDFITVNATVHNYSGRSADEFIVHLRNQFDTTVVFPDILIHHLGPYSSTNVSWDIQTPDLPAWCPMQVFIDYTNVIDEPNELDNQAIRPFTNGHYTLPGKIMITAYPSPTVAPRYSNVTISGSAWYVGTAVHLTDSSCAGATVTWNVVETGATGSTYSNSLGNYSFGIWAPWSPSTYHVKVHITDYTLDGDTATQFDITESVCIAPDLVSSINIGPATVWPGWCHWNSCVNILLNQALSGTVTVTNQGNAPSGPSTLNIDANGCLPNPSGNYPIPALAIGASFVVNLPPAMTYNTLGGYGISSTADVFGVVPECYEYNNSNSVCIMVHPPMPDIVSSGYLYNEYNECQFNNITFNLDNQGGVATGPFENSLDIYLGGIYQTTLYNTVDNIPPLTCTSTTFYWSSPHPVGFYTFVFKADYNNHVAEISEFNNNATVSTTLISCKPDLTVFGCQSLVVDPTDPLHPGNIKLTATIANYGLISASNFIVRFDVDGTPYDYSFTNTLNSGQTQTIDTVVPSPSYGCHPYSVTADYGNIINESNELNNEATGDLSWDFYLSDGCWGGCFWDYTQTKGQPVTLNVAVNNPGLYRASNLFVKFEVQGPGLPAGWTNLGNAHTFCGSTFCNCPFGINLPTPFAFPLAGDYLVKMTADPGHLYHECNEFNNELIVTVHVTDLPDYRVLSQYIAPSWLNPELNDSISIDLTYENIGMSSITPIVLYCRVDNTFLDAFTVPGLAHGTFTTFHVTKKWASNIRGIHIIRSIIDYTHAVTETDELNNEATRAIIVGKAPNLVPVPYSMTFSDSVPSLGEQILISTSIKNVGYDSCRATYSLYYLDDSLVEHPIGHQIFTWDTSQTRIITIPWTVVDTKTTIIGRISDGDPVEYDITDNEISKDLGGAMHLSFVTTPASCYGSTDGSAKVIISGGQSPYNILWSNGQTNDSISGGAGTYTLVVTDVNGLTLNGLATILQPPPLYAGISISSSATFNCVNTPVTFTAIPTNQGLHPEIQWKKNGLNVGSNSLTYTYIPNEGDSIWCTLASSESCIFDNHATSNVKVIHITQTPDPAGPIFGLSTVCQGQMEVVYHIDLVPNAYQYQWSLPSGAHGLSSSSSITVYFDNSATTGNITVRGMNYCGIGDSSTKIVVVNPKPLVPDTITGLATVCQGQTGISYSVPDATYATSYEWTLPSGATGASTTTNIIVDYGFAAVSGNISVRGHNDCGLGPVSNLFINVNLTPSTPLTVTLSGSTSFNAGDTVQLTALITNGGISPTYQWYLNDVAVGDNNPVFSFIPQDLDSVYCSVISSLSCIPVNTARSDVDIFHINFFRTIKLKLFLEGLFDDNTNTMFEANDINWTNGNVFPKFGAGIADRISIDLFSENSPFDPIGVSLTGVDLATTGWASVQIADTHHGNYFIRVRNRNHLEVWSSIPVPFNTNPVVYNFTNDALRAYKIYGGIDPQAQVNPNVYALYAGDFDQNLLVDFDDFNIFNPYLSEGVYGFTDADLNGNGLVDFDDFNIFEPRLIEGPFSQYPGMPSGTP
ncbi:MAG: glycine-rich domain-containing protein [Bacteroidota bacterium]